MVNVRWTDKALLQRDHEIALELAREQGIKLCLDPAELEIAKQTFLQISSIFWADLMCSNLAAIYVYDMDAQPPGVSKCDGYSSVSKPQNDGRRVASIGISIQALHAGHDYAIMVFLHEMAHVLSDFPSEHGPEYHAYLDRLIERYNQAAGTEITNDYFGLCETAQKSP